MNVNPTSAPIQGNYVAPTQGAAASAPPTPPAASAPPAPAAGAAPASSSQLSVAAERDAAHNKANANFSTMMNAFGTLPDDAKKQIGTQVQTNVDAFNQKYSSTHNGATPPTTWSNEYTWNQEAQASHQWASAQEAQFPKNDQGVAVPPPGTSSNYLNTLSNLNGGALNYMQARTQYLQLGGAVGSN